MFRNGPLTSYAIECPIASTFDCPAPLTATANPSSFRRVYTKDGVYVSQACSIVRTSSVDCDVLISDSTTSIASTTTFSPVPLRELTITATETGVGPATATMTPDTTSPAETDDTSPTAGSTATAEQTTTSSDASGKLAIFSWVWGSMVLVLATI